MHVLDEPQFPIVAWPGPNDLALNRPRFKHEVEITPENMQRLSGAGFNVSLMRAEYPPEGATPEVTSELIDRLVRLLDVSHQAGVRQLICPLHMRVGAGSVTPEWRKWLGEIVAAVRSHPGLYGYYLADEPRIDKRDDLARAMQAVRELDPDHLAYVNHWMVNMSFAGYRSYEELWNLFVEECRPRFISWDAYPFHRVEDADEWKREREAGNPCCFPNHPARIHPHYFENLDIGRQYARFNDLPLWHFTFSAGKFSNEPAVAEGEIRFQLMTGLAYGARALQWFTYSLNHTMIDADGEPTPNWHIARKVNAEVQTWAPVLRRLRSIGVYHHPCDLPYTRPLDQHVLGNKDDLAARGGPIVLGQFADDEGNEYALIVNRTPYEDTGITMKFGADSVEELSPETAEWTSQAGRDAKLSFRPGQGRLFRFRREIELA